MQKRAIAFVINSIGPGGAERVLSTVLSSIGARRDRYIVHVILLDKTVEFRTLPTYVVQHVLDAKGSFPLSLLLLLQTLRRLKPALIVSMLVRANLCSAIAGAIIGVPTILSERMHLGSHLKNQLRGTRLLVAKAVLRRVYRYATRIIGVSLGVTQNLIEEFSVPPTRTITIYNPYDLEGIIVDSLKQVEFLIPKSFVVAVGRLVPAKNFSQLIEAYLLADLPQTLVILGEGPERKHLERAVAAAGATNRVLLPGYVKNPFPIIAQASFYVSSSLNEGFPNAMAEAMILGTPVVSTDCTSGPAEILAGVIKLNSTCPEHAEFGILVPEGSVPALAQAMQAMSDPILREHYSRQARNRIQIFQSEKIAEEYWKLFDATIGEQI